MFQTVNFSSFVDAFNSADRGDQFSYQALRAIFDYVEEHQPDYALDVIEICCEWSESTLAEIKEYYSHDLDDDCEWQEVLDYVEDSMTIALYPDSANGDTTIVYIQC